MAERFLIRLNGGPHDGSQMVVEDGVLGMTWPLPAILPTDAGGMYRKAMESRLPPQEEGDQVMRGAEYEWEQAEP